MLQSNVLNIPLHLRQPLPLVPRVLMQGVFDNNHARLGASTRRGSSVIQLDTHRRRHNLIVLAQEHEHIACKAFKSLIST